MVKTLRVSESTYALVMGLVSEIQAFKGKRISVDEALKEKLNPVKKKSREEAWKILDGLRFKGPKTNCVDDIDIIQ